MNASPAPAGPNPQELERLLERVPEPHRAAVRAAVEQWSLAMWLAASRASPGEADPPGGAELAAAPLLRLYTSFLETLAGCGVDALDGSARQAPSAELASAVGELAGTLARLAGEAVPPHAEGPADGESTVRQLYDEYVDRWERRYREWMLSEDFARLQGILCNGALATRSTRHGGREEPS